MRSWDSVIYDPLYISIRLRQLQVRIFVTRAQLTIVEGIGANDCFIHDKAEWTYTWTYTWIVEVILGLLYIFFRANVEVCV